MLVILGEELCIVTVQDPSQANGGVLMAVKAEWVLPDSAKGAPYRTLHVATHNHVGKLNLCCLYPQLLSNILTVILFW